MGANPKAQVNAAVRLLVCSSTALSPRLPVAARDRSPNEVSQVPTRSPRDAASDPGRATVSRISGTAHVAFGGSDTLGPAISRILWLNPSTPNDHYVRFAGTAPALPGAPLLLDGERLSRPAPCRSPGAHRVRLAKVITWLCSSLSDELCPLLRIKSARLLIKPLPGEP